MTFPKHAIIQNVNKEEKEWWKGDYGGQRQHWFPAAYVEEIELENIDERVSGILLYPPVFTVYFLIYIRYIYFFLQKWCVEDWCVLVVQTTV